MKFKKSEYGGACGCLLVMLVVIIYFFWAAFNPGWWIKGGI